MRYDKENVTASTFGRKLGFPGREIYGRMPSRRAVAEVADEILEFLGLGKLCELEEVAKAVDLPEGEVDRILNILTQINLVKKGVQITSSGRNFLKLPVEKRKLKRFR